MNHNLYRCEPAWLETYAKDEDWLHVDGQRGLLCGGCGQFFACYRRDSKYCCNECRLKAYKEKPKRVKPLPQPYYAYVNLVKDGQTHVALKFGVEKVRNTRHIQQNRRCVYDITIQFTYKFESRNKAYLAERECKQTLVCRVIPKSDMPDGWTETTYCYNIEAIEAIYRKHGGVRI